MACVIIEQPQKKITYTYSLISTPIIKKTIRPLRVNDFKNISKNCMGYNLEYSINKNLNTK